MCTRRFMMRKKRCYFIVCSGLVLTLCLSGFSVFFEKEDSNHTPVAFAQRIEPKYNVLEPPEAIIHESFKVTNKEEATSSENVKKSDEKSNSGKNKVVINVNQTVQNKSQDIEVAKNKTLAQLGVLGVKESEKTVPKVIFQKLRWNLTVSFEDIGNIMKDTSFFSKLKPLDLSGPMLTSTRNRTANFSLAMPIKMGYCDCWEHYCYCCALLTNKQLHLNTKTCANFTFSSKSHNLDLTFKMDNTTIYNGIISADAPPLLCLGSIPSVADMCIHFSNMTYRVDRLAMHKSQLLGCTDFSLNIYNKTIGVFPVDCFQIPGDPNHHSKQENLIFPNFVP